MTLIILSFAWVLGIFLGSKFVLPTVVFLFSFTPLLFLISGRARKKQIIFSSCCLFLLAGGMVYYQAKLPLVNDTGYTIAWISSLRYDLADVLEKVLPEPQASLAQGIILGIRDNIPRTLQLDFARTGTAHILAVSGQNLSIVAGILVSFGIFLFGRRHYYYIWLALATLWLYTMLTGMEPPVVRGAVMASAFLAADLFGRQRSAFTALAFAAAVMVAVSPGVLWQVSFQLSFLAMAGLVFIYPVVQRQGNRLIETKLGEQGIVVNAANLLNDGFCVSLAALLAVWPLIARYFGIIAWSGPAATFLVVPVFPAIIVTGAIAGGLGLFVLPLAQVVAWTSWLFLSYMLLVVRLFALLPYTGGVKISDTAMWIYYSILILFIWLYNDKTSMAKIVQWLKTGWGTAFNSLAGLPVKWTVLPLAVAAILVWVTVATLPDNNLHVSFLDVGQGDAILFTKGRNQILVDGGPDGRVLMQALGREMPFWDRTIEQAVLTHPHADHVTGLLEVLNRYKVDSALFTDYSGTPDVKKEAPLYDDWLKLLRQKNIESVYARAGQQIFLGPDVHLDILNPQARFLKGTESDLDNNGVVVRVETGNVSFLITGDLMREGEAELVVRRENLASTVLKVGHHGSDTSTTRSFLGAVKPDVAVISVGKSNPFGHPRPEVMNRLKETDGASHIYRTDVSGKIELITDGVKLWVRTEK